MTRNDACRGDIRDLRLRGGQTGWMRHWASSVMGDRACPAGAMRGRSIVAIGRPRVLNPTPHLWNRAVNAYSVATSLAAATHDLGLRSVLGKEVNEP